MFSFRRKTQPVAARQFVVMEGLEGRCLLSGSALSSGPSSSHGGNSGPQMQVAATTVQAPSSGTVVGVDATAKTITVSAVQKGVTTQMTLKVDAAAKITADNIPVALSALLPGAAVSLKTSGKSPSVVTEIRAVGTDVEGKVTAVDVAAKTLTVAGKKGAAPTVFTIPASAIVVVKGGLVGLANVKPGAEAHVHLSALDGVTVATVRVENKGLDDRGVHDEPNDDRNDANEVEGVTTAIDLTARKLTVVGEHGGAATIFTIPVTASIRINGVAGALADITVGSFAEIHFSAADPTLIVSVRVSSPSV